MKSCHVALSLLLMALASAGQAQPSRILDGGTGLYLRQSATGVTVVDPTASAEALILPAGVNFSHLERMTDGWIAAGTRPTEAGRDLLILRATASQVKEVPLPEAASIPLAAALHMGPVVMTYQGELLGLVWLQGETADAMAVLSASWSGDRWTEPVIVSPPGPGGHIAPSGAVLDDGTWLVLWSAYDGEDDEILWSRKSKAGWSVAQQLNLPNNMPDIVPAVTAFGDGALAAWSWLDGSDYRLKMARFGAGVWTLSDFLGEPGSFFPSFPPSTGGPPTLLYRTAIPAGWKLHELDAAGRITRTAAIEELSNLRPLVANSGAQGLTLSWPTGDQVAPQRSEAVEWQGKE